jgi:hypothetical protein
MFSSAVASDTTLGLHGSNAAAVEVGKVKQCVEFPGVLLMGRILPSPSRSGLISFLAKAPRRSAPELLATDSPPLAAGRQAASEARVNPITRS